MLKESILGVEGDFWTTKQDIELEVGQSRRWNSKWGGKCSPSRPHMSKALYFDMERQMPKQFIKGRKLASCSLGQDRTGLANGLPGSWRTPGVGTWSPLLSWNLDTWSFLRVATPCHPPPCPVSHVNHFPKNNSEVGNSPHQGSNCGECHP